MITLSPEQGRSLYEQIYTAIKEEIGRGRLRSGEKLPSKRRLAQQLGVSIITVENAYAQLAAEGYLYPRERSGYFVAEVEKLSPPPRQEESACLPEEAAPRYWMDFQSRSVRTEHFPFAVWARIMRVVLQQQDTALLQPLQYNGLLPLRRAISDYLRENRGIHVAPAQIVVGAGTEYLQQLMVQLLGRDKIYAVEDPGYPKTGRIYESCGVACRYIPLQGGSLSVEGLRRKKVQVLHISPSHHFPTGTVMPISRRQELLRWAEEEDGYIIEDDYDSEFRLVGRPIPPLFGSDKQQRVIYINTFSKTMAPSIRVSYMVLPPALLEKFHSQLGFYACTVPSFDQYALAEFIAGGYFERHLSRMKTVYRQKRDVVIEAIRQSPLQGRFIIREEDAGLHFLLKLDTALPEEELRRRALERGIRLSFLSDYQHSPNKRSAHWLVISYAGIDTEKLPQVFDLLAEMI